MDDDKGSSIFSSDSDDIESIISNAEIASSGKKIKGKDGKSPTAKTPSRKSPRDHGQAQKKEVYVEEEEETNREDFDKVLEEQLEEEKPGKKWKREEGKSNQGTEALPLPLSPIQSQPPLEDNVKEVSGEIEGEVQVKNRRKA